MPNKKEDTVWVDVDVIQESGKAWLVSDSKVQEWIPKSQIIDSEDDLEVGKSASIELPIWLAEEKGFA